MPGYGSTFPKSEVKVGESWQIPMNSETSGVSLQGTANYKVSEVKTLTVPAGTYNVVKIDITTSNVHLSASSELTDVNLSVTLNGYVYLEKATGRTVQLQIEETVTGLGFAGISGDISVSMQMQLIQLTT
jgi:hypothetical protein